ncbi:MAG: hypothetical protein ACQUHE_10410 [Bacteroidia bacterium]
MNALKRITYNCQKATFLIEKKSKDQISIAEEIELKFHLVGCKVCRIYQQQSMLIDRILKGNLFESSLDSDFKEDLSKKISDAIEKNEKTS